MHWKLATDREIKTEGNIYQSENDGGGILLPYEYFAPLFIAGYRKGGVLRKLDRDHPWLAMNWGRYMELTIIPAFQYAFTL
jgi:hypothetical protein